MDAPRESIMGRTRYDFMAQIMLASFCAIMVVVTISIAILFLVLALAKTQAKALRGIV